MTVDCGFGAFPDSQLAQFFRGATPLGVGAISPASVDVTFSDEAYRLERYTLPRVGERVREMFPIFGATRHSLSIPFEVDVSYLVKINEMIRFPNGIYGWANPKSSTGRTDYHAQLISDGSSEFDGIPDGFQGETFCIVTPNSFPGLFSYGESLSQVRVFNRDTRLSKYELEGEWRNNALFLSKDGEPIAFESIKVDKNGCVSMTVDIPKKGLIGYKSRLTRKIFDFSRRDYRVNDWFEPIYGDCTGILELEPGRFYILYTKQQIRVPNHLAAEMSPMSARNGEFRSHYAGFFDPGFCGTITLEVRSPISFALRDDQPVGDVRFERVLAIPKKPYGMSGHNYQGQIGPKLSKHFLLP